jgi:hypothetical protein
VAMYRGEMSFEIFDYEDDIEDIIKDESKNSVEKLKSLQGRLVDGKLPQYLLSFIEQFSPEGSSSLAVHGSADMSNRSGADERSITRSRGLIGGADLEERKYPQAVHHIKMFYNKEKKARVFYRYVGSIKFLRNLRKL